MRLLFWVAILFGGAVGLALFTQFNQSNLVLFYPPYRVELSLNLALALLLLAFFVVWTILSTARHLSEMPARAAAYRERSRMNRAQAALRESIENLFAGRFARAERTAREAQAWPEQAQTAALIGARAAHRMQETERRDAWMAQVTDPEREQARLVSMAELLVDARDAEGALETIAQLQAQGARQIHVQRIALRAHQHLKNWTEVLRLARSLEKRNALHPVLALRLKQLACEALLEERRHDVQGLQDFWRSLSTDERRAARIAEPAARYFAALGRQDEARKIVEDALKVNWDSRLVLRYAECAEPGRALPQIQQAEKWLTQHPVDADLYFTLGVLCLGEKLWGKAQSSFERALKYADADLQRRLRVRAHLALAKMFEETERPEEAQRHYRESAILAA
ncbi:MULTISPECIES: heme biosynthesis protein HemY [Cupriavidus]|uniref:heme biosynthesis protein HemY n=1 Tax=Cupriavidus TaxID=106589 RepID=UPI00157B9A1B|nr:MULTISPECIES: heme biosynthesis protein HemY [Cupriavidus]MBB1635760.1 heme biosynthesis protein HemY [Cupriavidus sp. UME77]MCP3023006.1 heme biosynthesis protein HemY [Cupriavidus basilensis]MDR3380798.1 heme biosynthesis protein HemY [Cupriavidus basilensis]NUA25425.1 heme biosynthesis protein HemY [Cupriavidus basilensis]